MKNPRSIQEFLNKIEPYKNGAFLIELFGSYARGDYKPSSDIDVLVVLKKQNLRDKFLEAADAAMEAVDYQELLSPIIMDVKHYQKIKKFNTDFYCTTKKEGKVLWQAKI